MPEGGSIINSSSVNSDMPSPQLAPYAMTKAGDRQLHREPGADVRRQGHPGQQRRARPDLDAADPGDHAAGEGGELRRAGADGPRRASPPSSRRSTCCWPATRRPTSRARGSRSPEASRSSEARTPSFLYRKLRASARLRYRELRTGGRRRRPRRSRRCAPGGPGSSRRPAGHRPRPTRDVVRRDPRRSGPPAADGVPALAAVRVDHDRLPGDGRRSHRRADRRRGGAVDPDGDHLGRRRPPARTRLRPARPRRVRATPSVAEHRRQREPDRASRCPSASATSASASAAAGTVSQARTSAPAPASNSIRGRWKARSARTSDARPRRRRCTPSRRRASRRTGRPTPRPSRRPALPGPGSPTARSAPRPRRQLAPRRPRTPRGSPGSWPSSPPAAPAAAKAACAATIAAGSSRSSRADHSAELTSCPRASSSVDSPPSSTSGPAARASASDAMRHPPREVDRRVGPRKRGW